MPSFLERVAAWLGAPAGPTPAAEPPRARAGPPALSPDDPRLPDASRPKVSRILELAADIEARAARDLLLTEAATEVRQMRDQHLPQLVGSYADIPPAHRAEIFRATGRSASYNLNQALDRMIERAEALSRDLAQEDINSFADNLRFIERRYGKPDPLA